MICQFSGISCQLAQLWAYQIKHIYGEIAFVFSTNVLLLITQTCLNNSRQRGPQETHLIVLLLLLLLKSLLNKHWWMWRLCSKEQKNWRPACLCNNPGGREWWLHKDHFCVCPATERWYIAKSSVIGWAHAKYDPWLNMKSGAFCWL